MLNLEKMSPKQADFEGKKPKRIELRMPEEMVELLIKEAQELNCSINALILRKLESTMAQRPKKRK